MRNRTFPAKFPMILCQYAFLYCINVKLNCYVLILTSDPQHHHLHHHQPPVMMMMMPGLTEEECQRYQELLEIRCQYERQNEQQQRGATRSSSGGVEEAGEAPSSSSVVDVNRNAALSEHEMALIEEELRHLEFKCRNILRAQKMQQLRERCLKAWMMEEETEAAGNPGNNSHPDLFFPNSGLGFKGIVQQVMNFTNKLQITNEAKFVHPTFFFHQGVSNNNIAKSIN